MCNTFCMIRLTNDHPRSPVATGFAWWYVDMIDANGDGFVLIWSTGLPFLPHVGRPGCEAAVNLAVYRGGRQVFYVLESIPAADVELDGDVIRFGRSWFRTMNQRGQRVVTAWLDCPVPGSTARLRGTIKVRGEALTVAPEGDPDTTHAWMPLSAPAEASVRLHAEGFRYEARGRAYHDRNCADLAMDALGIDSWIWGRVAMPDHDLVYYHLLPKQPGAAPMSLLLEARAGSVRRLPGGKLRVAEPRRDRYGLGWHAAVIIEAADRAPVQVRLDPPIDSGPFYLRHRLRSEGAWGWGEACVPDKVDRSWQRPFVRMRVSGATSSAWSPLFTGPSTGRLLRLARWWGIG